MVNPLAEVGTQKLDYVEYKDIPELVRNADHRDRGFPFL